MIFLKNKSYKPKIFPFYPKRNLQNEDNFKIYKTHLNEVFKDSNIRNIGVTGNYGVGKSSILYSYDVLRNSKIFRFRKKTKFLYISLADFLSTEIKSNKNRNMSAEINTLESSLLYQILARCKEKDIPESSCEKYKETNHFIFFYSLIFTMIIAVFLSLIFKEEFKTVLSEFFDVADEKMVSIFAYLYLIFGLLIVVFSLIISKKIIRKVELRSINFKTSHADVDLGIKKFDTYIDYNKVEIVYLLTKISKKINYTVVFEDMDRLDKQICLEIFSKLRDINRLINIRLRNKRKTVRFIYVFNDKIFNVENRTKFFDYLLPIVPSVNQFNSEEFLKLSLKNVGVSDLNDELITKISAILYDYRKINSVINEFQLFRDIKKNNSFLNNYYVNINDCEILAFVVYKILCPQDYFKIRSGESDLLKLFIDDQSNFKNGKYWHLIQYFVQNSYLTKRALGLLGNSNDFIKKCYLKKLKSKYDSEKLSAIKYILKERIMSKELNKLFNENYYWKQTNLDFQANLLCYLIINKIDTCDWFFQASKLSNPAMCQKVFSIILKIPDYYLQELIVDHGNSIKNSIIICLKSIISNNSSDLPNERYLWHKISRFLGQETVLEMAIVNHPITVDGERKTINDVLTEI